MTSVHSDKKSGFLHNIKETIVIDHRSKVAEQKRRQMHAKLLDAAMRVFSETRHPSPVIDDVIREAKVSRGTFYKYFESLDQILVAIGQELSNQTTADSLPMYDVLPEPWQRAAVGFRLFLVRALLDQQWAALSRALTFGRIRYWLHNA